MTNDVYMMPFERDVLDVIKGAGGRYVSGRDLASACGGNPRTVRAAVKVLVELHHEPIVTLAGAEGGFAYTTDPDQLRFCIIRLTKQVASIARKIRAYGAPVTLEKTGGQLRLTMEDYDVEI